MWQTRRRIQVAALLITFVLLAAAEVCLAADLNEIRLGDSPFPPYTEGKEGSPPTGGIVPKIMEEIFSRLGLKVSIELYPWKRLLKLAELGRTDGITLLMKTKEREKYLVFSQVLFKARELFYFHNSRLKGFNWKIWSDLKPYTIGLVDGFTYGQGFMQALQKHQLKVEYAPTSHINFEKLAAGRLDLCLEEEMVSKAWFTANPKKRIYIRPAAKPVTVYPYYLAFSRKSAAASLLPRVNRIILQMQTDGTMNRLLGRNQ
ncbi:MAG: transporter substrate-binding domain-containing protein [Desulfarculaceae bacterium]|jgi:polar amino acid transport system substrate-binding protein